MGVIQWQGLDVLTEGNWLLSTSHSIRLREARDIPDSGISHEKSLDFLKCRPKFYASKCDVKSVARKSLLNSKWCSFQMNRQYANMIDKTDQ